MGDGAADSPRQVRAGAAAGDARQRHRHVDRGGEGEPLRSALEGSRPRLRHRRRLLHVHGPRRRPHRARRARAERLSHRPSRAPTTIFAPASKLADFVKERNPKRIGVNMSDEIGPADGLSVTMLAHLKKTLGEPYASRLVSAEKLRVASSGPGASPSEIVAFGEAAGIAMQLAERALSNEVITVGQDHTRGRRLVAAGSAARERAWLGIRHAFRLRDRARTGSSPPPPPASSSPAT